MWGDIRGASQWEERFHPPWPPNLHCQASLIAIPLRPLRRIHRNAQGNPKGAQSTFEADPIGRRLECLPKKGINIKFTLFLKVFLMGPWGPQGLINYPQGPPGIKTDWGAMFFFGRGLLSAPKGFQRVSKKNFKVESKLSP